MISVVSGPYHYIRRGDGVEELYDIEADLAETADLAARAEMAPVLTRLRALATGMSPR
jgi:hypothetical protein